jgi:hypothetical protein
MNLCPYQWGPHIKEVFSCIVFLTSCGLAVFLKASVISKPYCVNRYVNAAFVSACVWHKDIGSCSSVFRQLHVKFFSVMLGFRS